MRQRGKPVLAQAARAPYARCMSDSVVEQLGTVDVLTPAGERTTLGSYLDGRPVLLAMIRHFG
jgi:hypothetical protein